MKNTMVKHMSVDDQAMAIVNELIELGEKQGHTWLAFHALGVIDQLKANQRRYFTRKGRGKAYTKNRLAVAKAFKETFEQNERVTYVEDDMLVVYYVSSNFHLKRLSKNTRETPTTEALAFDAVSRKIEHIVHEAFIANHMEHVTVTLKELLFVASGQLQGLVFNGMNYGFANSLRDYESYTPLVQKSMRDYAPLIRNAMKRYAQNVEAPLFATYIDDKLVLSKTV